MVTVPEHSVTAKASKLTTSPSNSDAMMGAKAKSIVHINNSNFDLTDTAAKAKASKALDDIMSKPGGQINGQKIGTQGAQFEASKLRAQISGQAATPEQAEKIATQRGYVKGSMEPTKTVARATAR